MTDCNKLTIIVSQPFEMRTTTFEMHLLNVPLKCAIHLLYSTERSGERARQREREKERDRGKSEGQCTAEKGLQHG
jgi:hypothetical protein